MMFPSDDDTPRRSADVQIGQDLSLLSIAELEQRIRTLEGEIERTREDIDRKSSHKSKAESLFSVK